MGLQHCDRAHEGARTRLRWCFGCSLGSLLRVRQNSPVQVLFVYLVPARLVRRTARRGGEQVRLRDKLFRALVAQEIGYFDSNSTGELTSRLASDTTAVGDQVALNVNVFLRSLISAVGALAFMFVLSWRLSVLAFCTVPPTIFISNFYGK